MSARLLQLPIPAAAEPTSPWGAPPEAGPRLLPLPLPPASLGEARSLRDALTGLLARERAASADFLVALADFDQRRGWEALGHRSLFAFLSCELHLSDGAAFVRISAARLLPRFPAVEAALRDGRLCLSTAGSVAAVLKPENQAEWPPRFFGLSARQARELAATLVPRADPPRREVLTRIDPSALRTYEVDRPSGGARAPLETQASAALRTSEGDSAPATASPSAALTPYPTSTSNPDPTATRTPAVVDLPLPSGETAAVRGPATPTPLSTIEPLSADLLRLHLTVSSQLVKKLAAARDGLAHALPGATTEQVLEAALDLLLEKQARRKGLVKRPRTTAAAEPPAQPLPGSAAARPRHIPAAVRREVWLRDGQRCQHPLDSGGTCGATARLELDHLVPLALGGPSTADNLRVVCAFHNRAAARATLGEALVEDQRARAQARRTR